MSTSKSLKATDRFKYCDNCGKKFFCQYGVGIGRWNNVKYCSRQCKNEGFVGHPQYNTGSTHFKIGHKTSVGRVVSDETRMLLSIANMGNKPWNTGVYVRLSPKTEFKSGHVPTNKGTIGVMKKNNTSFNKGHTPHFKNKPNISIRKENHWNWKGGITKENLALRLTLEYKIWRREVFERDDYTCQICGKRGSGTLHADHIKPFAYFPELRNEISNGRTLCESCHRKTDTYGHKARNHEKKVC